MSNDTQRKHCKRSLQIWWLCAIGLLLILFECRFQVIPPLSTITNTTTLTKYNVPNIDCSKIIPNDNQFYDDILSNKSSFFDIKFVSKQKDKFKLASPGIDETFIASFGGSGNTFTRLLIEYLTQYYTGSFYGDVLLSKISLFKGEKYCAHELSFDGDSINNVNTSKNDTLSVIGIKLHPELEYDHFIESRSDSFCNAYFANPYNFRKCKMHMPNNHAFEQENSRKIGRTRDDYKPQNRKKFVLQTEAISQQRWLFIVRNPIDAFWAEFEFQKGWRTRHNQFEIDAQKKRIENMNHNDSNKDEKNGKNAKNEKDDTHSAYDINIHVNRITLQEWDVTEFEIAIEKFIQDWQRTFEFMEYILCKNGKEPINCNGNDNENIKKKLLKKYIKDGDASFDTTNIDTNIKSDNLFVMQILKFENLVSDNQNVRLFEYDKIVKFLFDEKYYFENKEYYLKRQCAIDELIHGGHGQRELDVFVNMDIDFASISDIKSKIDLHTISKYQKFLYRLNSIHRRHDNAIKDDTPMFITKQRAWKSVSRKMKDNIKHELRYYASLFDYNIDL